MARAAAWGYRVIYMYLLTMFGIRVLPLEASWRAVLVSVHPASFLALSTLVLLTGVTRRPLGRWVWTVTTIWCLAFGWWAWLSGDSPFVMHELHTLDPAGAAAEVKSYYLHSIPLFVLLVLWFLSFPVIHRIEISKRLGRPPDRSR